MDEVATREAVAGGASGIFELLRVMMSGLGAVASGSCEASPLPMLVVGTTLVTSKFAFMGDGAVATDEVDT